MNKKELMTKEQFTKNMVQLFRESQGIALTKTYLSNIKLIITKDLKSLIKGIKKDAYNSGYYDGNKLLSNGYIVRKEK